MGRESRPELTGPPELYYNEDEAAKYTSNTRVLEIQAKLTYRAVELLALPPDGGPRLLLDVGCGSGVSGEVLADMGHQWVGLDIAPAMLDVAVERGLEGGDVLLGDMGHGVPFREGSFDGAVSISAAQWLCNADTSRQDPRRRMAAFFRTLYRVLNRGARAVLQIYPQDARQAEMLVAAAMQAGFSGGLVVDYPHSTRAKKHFLVLMVGSSGAQVEHLALDGDPDEDEVPHTNRVRRSKGRGESHKAWLLKKKVQRVQRGLVAKPTTKYSGRKRKPKF